jgi:exopolysaccharide biosynthesis polyprenyl glycosylphosphotransferase
MVSLSSTISSSPSVASILSTPLGTAALTSDFIEALQQVIALKQRQDRLIYSELLEGEDQSESMTTAAVSMYFFPGEEKPFRWLLKRSLDRLLSLLGLVLILPLLLLTALAIKLESPGPVLFKQKRIGLHGKTFHIYKFRSMYQDAEQRLESLLNTNQTNSMMFKMFDDPRVTKVGKFIRKFSIDELPQLLNVLRGEMSLVGPRPPLPREVAAYQDWQHVRLATVPGLTGAWQVFGRSSVTKFERVVELDFKYLYNWSLLVDLGLLLRTVPIVLTGKGAC